MRPAEKLAAFVAVLVAAAAAPSAIVAGGADDLRDRIELERQREGVLTSEIEAATGRIRGLEAQIGPLAARLDRLEVELGEKRERLGELSRRYARETRRLAIVTADRALAERRLEGRLVSLYQHEPPDLLSIVLTSDGFDDLIDQLQLFSDIARRDREIADQLGRAQEEVRTTRRRTGALKQEVWEATRALADRATEQRSVLGELVAQRSDLEQARAGKEALLDDVRASRHRHEEDLEAMLAASAGLATTIQAAQAAAPAETPSAAGLVWPVHGVLTSGFGPRWGRMHEGIDIAAPTGTPIRSAAAGTVVFAGWAGGYGNLVVVDHGGGLATAYGHQSAIFVTAGHVEQGRVLGAVGSTGNSTGPHLHFEVRISGAPVDPLGYL
jgi:murein DD-endopeptidase MepM/ murein hydrolase activator NlpD